MKYKIEITETLQKSVWIEAESREEAEKEVKKLYRNQEIILSADDFIESDIQVVFEDKKGEIK